MFTYLWTERGRSARGQINKKKQETKIKTCVAFIKNRLKKIKLYNSNAIFTPIL